MRARTTGSLGTEKGSRSIITALNCAPGTSTPCQKLLVANSTAPAISGLRNCSSRVRLGAVPCNSKGYRTLSFTRSNIWCICR